MSAKQHGSGEKKRVKSKKENRIIFIYSILLRGYPQVEPKFTTITVLDNPQWSARERTYQIGYPDICYVADNATRVFNDDYIILWGKFKIVKFQSHSII